MRARRARSSRRPLPHALALALCCALPAQAASMHAMPHEIYATNEADGTLSIIDAATLKVVDTLALGKRPRGLAVSPDGRTLYVALSGSPSAGPGIDESTLPPPDRSADGIGVIDLRTRKRVRTLRGLTDPEQLALSADGRTLYVASEDSGHLAQFDTATGRLAKQWTVGGEPEGVGTSRDSRWVCATSEADGTVSLIDARTQAVVHTTQVGLRPRNCRFSRDGRRVYVPAELDATLSVVDVASGRKLRTIPLPGDGIKPMGIALSHDGRTAFVTTGRGRSLLAVDLAQGRVRDRVAAGERPWGVALSHDGRRLYTADGPSNAVSVIDAATMKPIASIAVGHKPWGVAAR